MTAKDVSLLITFREVVLPPHCDGGGDRTGAHTNTKQDLPVPQPHPRLPTFRFLSAGGRRFRAMLSVIDLDPKPVHRISTWVKRKEEWLETYFNSIGNGYLSGGDK